ncbi:MAG: hypothetical protein MUF42_15340 [Cytophagaceae bacterium]|nr:hypothetical protein [Cytophagaceae bacterium]
MKLEKALQEKEKERQEKVKIQKVLISYLHSSGVTVEDIAVQLKISETEIAHLLQ